MPERQAYTAAEVDAAVDQLSAPGRLEHAQAVVTHAAPSLQRILNAALYEGGYFDEAHEQQVRRAVELDDIIERDTAMRTLVAEESQLAMLIGVAIGFELARELSDPSPSVTTDATDGPDSDPPREGA